MRVILRENIENLGKKGDIVKVAPGYGRNFLIPKRMATIITPTNAKMIAIEQKALQKGLKKEMSTYNELIGRLNQINLSFTRKTSEKDIIFGSVNSADIKDALEELGFNIEKKKIILDEPIKRLGHYTVPIKIFHEERAEVKIEVAKEGAPSEDAAKGVEVTASEGEKAETEEVVEAGDEEANEEETIKMEKAVKSREIEADAEEEKQEELPAEAEPEVNSEEETAAFEESPDGTEEKKEN